MMGLSILWFTCILLPFFSAVRTYVLTDTVECQESRFAGLTSLTNFLAIPVHG
jgi:hypothetical protein